MLEITKLIRSMATPIFLGLDRKIYEGRFIDYRLRLRRTQANRRRRTMLENYGSSALDSSLEEVQQFIFDYIRKIALKQPAISEEFKRAIVQLSFEFIDDDRMTMIPSDSRAISQQQTQVLAAIKDLDMKYLDYQVNSFFTKIAKIIEDNGDGGDGGIVQNASEVSPVKLASLRKWWNNSSQLKKIDKIIQLSQKYQLQIAELKAPLKKLEKITSNFLREGKKEITVANDGELKVTLASGRKASVFELSSGEKQIVIMIAHLIFEEDQKPSGIFIIDEPELSLHLAWQEIFIDAITEASPKTQFILATHSPSIVAKVEREVFCQDLNKLNTNIK